MRRQRCIGTAFSLFNIMIRSSPAYSRKKQQNFMTALPPTKIKK
uniref:Uncharacterized protein n=1 Tax=Arundo donax TaxID=35708 RepID=A0A0A9BIQ7_ARUDO